MIFYLGSSESLPIIERIDTVPSIHTTVIGKDDEGIRLHINQPFIVYIGTEEGCGCKFRHSLLDGTEWLEVTDDDKEYIELEQQYQQLLFEYIKGNVSKNKNVEVYGCWDGNLSEPKKFESEITLEEMLQKNFYFKEQGLYKIKIGG